MADVSQLVRTIETLAAQSAKSQKELMGLTKQVKDLQNNSDGAINKLKEMSSSLIKAFGGTQVLGNITAYNKQLFEIQRQSNIAGRSFIEFSKANEEVAATTKISRQEFAVFYQQLNVGVRGLKLTTTEITNLTKALAYEFGPSIENVNQALGTLKDLQSKEINLFKNLNQQLRGPELNNYVQYLITAKGATEEQVEALFRLSDGLSATSKGNAENQNKLLQFNNAIAQLKKSGQDLIIAVGQPLADLFGNLATKLAGFTKFANELANNPAFGALVKAIGTAVAAKGIIKFAMDTKSMFTGGRGGTFGNPLFVKEVGSLGGLTTGDMVPGRRLGRRLGRAGRAAGGVGGAALRGAGGLVSILQKVGSTLVRFLGPIGIGIGILTILWTTSDKLRNAVGKLGSAFGGLIEKITNLLSPVFGFLGDIIGFVVDKLGSLVDVLGQAIDWFTNFLGLETVGSKNKKAEEQNLVRQSLDPTRSMIESGQISKEQGFQDALIDSTLRKIFMSKGLDATQASNKVQRFQAGDLSIQEYKAIEKNLKSAIGAALSDGEGLKQLGNNIGVEVSKGLLTTVNSDIGQTLDRKFVNVIAREQQRINQLITDELSVQNEQLKTQIAFENELTGDYNKVSSLNRIINENLSQQLKAQKEQLGLTKVSLDAAEKKLKTELGVSELTTSVLRETIDNNSSLKNDAQRILEQRSAVAKVEQQITGTVKEQILLYKNQLAAIEMTIANKESLVSLDEASLRLNESLLGPLGKSFELRSRIFDNIDKIISEVDAQIDITRSKIQQNTETEKLISLQTELNQLETKRIGALQRQADLTKSMREGYVNALMAFTNVQGAFSKLIITKETGLAEAMRKFSSPGGLTLGNLGAGGSSPIMSYERGTGQVNLTNPYQLQDLQKGYEAGGNPMRPTMYRGFSTSSLTGEQQGFLTQLGKPASPNYFSSSNEPANLAQRTAGGINRMGATGIGGDSVLQELVKIRKLLEGGAGGGATMKIAPESTKELGRQVQEATSPATPRIPGVGRSTTSGAMYDQAYLQASMNVAKLNTEAVFKALSSTSGNIDIQSRKVTETDVLEQLKLMTVDHVNGSKSATGVSPALRGSTAGGVGGNIIFNIRGDSSKKIMADVNESLGNVLGEMMGTSGGNGRNFNLTNS